MEIITDEKDLAFLTQNRFEGCFPQLVNSRIKFAGKGNVLYCGKGTRLYGCDIIFNGDNSLTYISGGVMNILLNANLFSNSVLYIGRDNYFNGVLRCQCSEQKHIFIGNNCLFSFNIWLRTADPHLIYSIDTQKRINESKSIYIGDSVWIGQSAIILKGSQIHSGSIIGAASVVANKKINSNCIAAGNPSKVITQNVFWNGKSVHAFTDEDSENYLMYTGQENIFTYNEDEYISYDRLDRCFSEKITALEKLRKIENLGDKKNRFAFKR